ncbi:MAG: thiamine pyrophosphate-binding protein [Dehalococcoidia bacterium]|nr:thiamine pyrophosphate-binding protein [Dehalococcoidia bacterium]
MGRTAEEHGGDPHGAGGRHPAGAERPPPPGGGGPVHRLQYFEADAPIPSVVPLPPPAPDPQDVWRSADLLAGARRPVIWAGGGAVASGAGPEVLALAHALDAGVLTTLTGRGVIPEDDPLCLGYFPTDAAVQELVAAGDVLLAVGTRFQGFNTQTYRMRLPSAIVHVDIDADEFNLNYPAAATVHSDAKAALQEIIAVLDGRASAEDGWRERSQEARQRSRANQRALLGPHEGLLDVLREGLPHDAIVVKDSTIPAYTWGNRLLEVYEPRTSLHAASMAIGPGLPLALGAAVAHPDRPVALITGDGGFLLAIGELSTAAQYGLKVLVMVFNDGGYGVLRRYQETLFKNRQIAVDMAPIDFAQVAQGMGVPGRRVSSVAGFAGAVAWGLAQPGPALLDIDLNGIGPMAVPYRVASPPSFRVGQ